MIDVSSFSQFYHICQRLSALGGNLTDYNNLGHNQQYMLNASSLPYVKC